MTQTTSENNWIDELTKATPTPVASAPVAPVMTFEDDIDDEEEDFDFEDDESEDDDDYLDDYFEDEDDEEDAE